MSTKSKIISTLGAIFLATAVAHADDLYMPIGSMVTPPIGWRQFCSDNPRECAQPSNSRPRDIVMTTAVQRDLERVNRIVNDAIKPVTDLEHWGIIENWSYPIDGAGDCEDYVLLKRKLLIDAGWPRDALLITVVRDRNDEGHAVLIVKTDAGEFVLDNETTEILPWYRTGYRYIKRQSQQDSNVWVSIGEPRRSPLTASTR